MIHFQIDLVRMVKVLFFILKISFQYFYFVCVRVCCACGSHLVSFLIALHLIFGDSALTEPGAL